MKITKHTTPALLAIACAASFVTACGADPASSSMSPAGSTAGTGGLDPMGTAGGAGGDVGVVMMPPEVPGGGELDVGTKAIHRLSNSEYDNTVRALLQTTLSPGAGFVLEESEDGFDNLAEALAMSTRQFEDYAAAARELAAGLFADPAALATVVTCDLAVDAACAGQVITNFGLRAFRRPLEAWENEQLLGQYTAAVAQGATPASAMEHTVRVILLSPQFLYRMELDADPTTLVPRALNGYELASRLSYLFWGSMPDDTLFELAKGAELLTPEGLVAQVDRMLTDPRSATLVSSFAAQWLGGGHLTGHTVDPAIFPSWDAELGIAMRAELDAYFSEFLFGDRPYAEFLTADINFVNARLATHYGVAAPAAEGLTRIENAADERAGFLGLAGFLTATSKANRTSPIARGNRVLDAMLCVKLTLPENLVVGDLPPPSATTTIREQLAQHREDAACAPCHNQIDPIGLSLEKYDGLGSYREEYEGGLAIDTSATTMEGTTFDGLAGLSQTLTQDTRFVPCAARKAFGYGLGRTVGPSGPYLQQVVTDWTASGTPTLRNLFKELVKNDVFRFRRGEPAN